MAGHRKFQSLRDKLTPAQRERSKARLSELQKEMLLSELRTRRPNATELADELGVSSPVSPKWKSNPTCKLARWNESSHLSAASSK